MVTRPYIIHRGRGPHTRRPVSHRATGAHLGFIGRHFREHGQAEWWSAWLPDEVEAALGLEGDAVNADPELGMHAAANALLDPGNACPAVTERRCDRWHREQRFIMGRPKHGPCAECETIEAAIQRHRTEHPEQWEHHDLLVQLAATPA